MRRIGKEIKNVQVLIARYVMKHMKCDNNERFSKIQTDIMEYLYMSEKTICQKDIEQEFKLRKSTISEILKNMETKGIIEKIDVQTDFRKKEIELTNKGKNIIQSLTEELRKMEELIGKNIKQEDLDVFFKVTEQVKKNLAEDNID